MSKRDGLPCKVCGGNVWNNDAKCVHCKSENDRRYRLANAEKVKARKKKYIEENREKVKDGYDRWKKNNLDKKKDADRRWAAANKDKAYKNHKKWRDVQSNAEKVAENNKKWREENPERAKEYARLWRERNPEKSKARVHRRRSMVRGGGGSYTENEWNQLVAHYGEKCLCCGRSDLPLTADHIVPVVRGGSSNIDNIQPLCLSCNVKKATKTIDYRPDSGIERPFQIGLFDEV